MAGNDHFVELLPAYALGCLDEDEYVVIAKHLAACEGCRAELRSYAAVADQLALGVPDVPPPARLKERLMHQVRSSDAQAQSRSSWWQQLAAFIRRTTPVWGLVGMLLIVALATSNVWLWQQLGQQQAAPRPGALDTIGLAGTEVAPEATGLIIVSVDGEHGTLVVDRLPQLGTEQEYQLWLIQDGQRTSGGVFSVGPDGYGSVWVSSPQPLSSYSAFGITIEPKGGSPGPTGERVLGSNL
jgi:anti-sigma-K factor RskA